VTFLTCDAIEMVIVPRERDLGGFSVRRALPSKQRQMVGPSRDPSCASLLQCPLWRVKRAVPIRSVVSANHPLPTKASHKADDPMNLPMKWIVLAARGSSVRPVSRAVAALINHGVEC
jgi:hypothetical protein